MAEVPGAQYEPYFTAQPTERPVQLRGVDVSGGAFGENVASALGVFGRGVEQGANEVFSRAMALRRLQVDGQIRDLTTQYYNEVTPLQTDFLSQKGNNAGTDAQTAHLASLETVRQKYLDQAKQYGVFGADKFGAEAASMQRSFIRESAVHSAVETKSALKQSHRDAILALQDQARGARTPEDLEKINEKIRNERSTIATMDGEDDVTRDYNIKEEISKSNTQNTIGRMRRDPSNATAIGDAAVKTGNIDAAGQDTILREGQASIRAGASVWHRNLLSGKDTSLGERKIDPNKLVDTIYGMEGRSRGPLITNKNSPYYGQRALPGGVMPGNLKPWLQEAGMPPMTEDEYANDPKAQRQLMAFKLSQAQEKYGSANQAAMVWFTGQPISAKSLGATDRQQHFVGTTGQGYLQRFNSLLARNATAGEIGAAAEAHGRSVENETFQDVGEQYRQVVTDRQYTEESRQRRSQWENNIALRDSIIQGNPDTGQPYTGYEDFAANPANAQVIANGMAIDPKFVENVANRIKGFEKAKMVETNIGHKHDLLVEMDDDRAAFMKHSFFDDKQLSQRDQIFFHNLQAKLIRQGFVDPNVGRAYNDLALSHPTDVPDKSTDPQGYKNYKGRLFMAMQAWEEVNKRPLKLGTPEGNKALTEINDMLVQQLPSGWFGFKNKAYNIEPEVPEEWAKGARLADPRATDDDIRYAWIKGQNVAEFERMYAKDTKGGPTSPDARPTTVRSSLPATPSAVPAKPTPPEPTAPTAAQVNQDDKLTKSILAIGAKAVSDWLAEKGQEVMAGGTPEAQAQVQSAERLKGQTFSLPREEAPAGTVPEPGTPRATRRFTAPELGRPYAPRVSLEEAPPGSVPGRGKGEK